MKVAAMTSRSLDPRPLSRRLFCLSAAVTGALIATSAQAADDEKKKGGGKGYTQFPMITVSTEANASHHGTLSVDMGLYTEDDKLQAQIKSYKPRLQDAYLSRLQAYANALNSHSLADPDYIALQLQQATDRVLGHTGVKVLLGSVLLKLDPTSFCVARGRHSAHITGRNAAGAPPMSQPENPFSRGPSNRDFA